MTNEMTNEQLEELVQTLEENVSEDAKILRNIPEGNIYTEDIINEAVNTTGGELGESEDGICSIVAGTLDDRSEDALKEIISKDDNIDENEATQLMYTIMRYNKKEKFNIYNELPERFKAAVRNIAAGSGVGKTHYNSISATLLDEFIIEANVDKEFVDIQKAIETELNIIPSLTDISLENTKDIMEIKLIETADHIKEHYPEKAELLYKISEVFTTTYTLSTLREFLKADRKTRNKVAEDNPNYDKFCKEFNLKADKSVFKIRDINMVAPVLNRVLPVEDISNEDIQNFIIVFCKYCKTLDQTKVEDVVYIYYFINDIIMLDYNYDQKTDFSKTLIENIIITINDIKECQESYEERFPKRKQKH